ncbi:hypothetical protein JX266_011944 [Neoarthrinium moseri]|nr:hypothetical protein JX266_011944 [Neoarthrinium moseri]
MTNVRRIGFTQLSASDEFATAAYRVKYGVHGLRGHPQTTWEDDRKQSKDDEQLASSGRRSGFRSFFTPRRRTGKTNRSHQQSDDASGEKIFWPSDYLVGDLPDARVWTYGYDADVIGGMFDANNKNSVSQHGRDLAVKLERDIDNTEPIIFVAHSLGGVIVKDALRRSVTCRLRTRLVVFLGTPHRGSSSAGWGLIASNLASAALQDSNRTILRALEVNSEVLDNIQEEFQRLAFEQRIAVHSFQEAKGLSGVKGLSGKVVDDFSSKIGLPPPLETVESIDANHMQMARCTDKDDAQYRGIYGVLRQFIRSSLPQETHAVKQSGAEDAPGGSNILLANSGRGISARNTRPPIFLIPLMQNRNFVGRSTALETLQDKFFVSKISHRVAIVGLGGVGKTQIALQLAYWIKANLGNVSILRLGIRTKKDEDTSAKVRQYLESGRAGKWFLILDNADDMDVLNGSPSSEGGIIRYLPESEDCPILFTTRSRDVALAVAGSDIIAVEEMDQKEAGDFLAKSVMQKDSLRDAEATRDLLQELTHLPLAIAQAAAYLNRNPQVSIKRYLELVRGTEDDAVRLLSREFHDSTRYRGGQNAVAATWLVSFDRIRDVDSGAADLLSFISLIEPRAIPRSLLPQKQAAVEMESSIGTLCGYAFLVSRDDGTTYDMHRLVHIASKMWNREEHQLQRIKLDSILHMAEVFPGNDPAHRRLWRTYLPHATRLLQETHDVEIEQKFLLLGLVAGALHEDRRVAEALKYYLIIHGYRARYLPETDRKLVQAKKDLAGAYTNSRRSRKGMAILKPLVEVCRVTFGEEDLLRLDSEHELASAYLDNGQETEAIEILEHVVKVTGRMLEENSRQRLASQYMLARAYLETSRVGEAIALLEYVVGIISRTLALDDPNRLLAQYELGRAYLGGGQITKAIEILEHVVALEADFMDADDSSRLLTLYWLGSAYVEGGKIKEAVEILEHVVAVEAGLLDADDTERQASVRLLETARARELAARSPDRDYAS